MSNNYTVFDVAHWFLSKEYMIHKKVQKLCYYAQAWHYALYDNALFVGDFEAWAHGPVNRQLWNKLKNFAYDNVTPDAVGNTKAIDEETQEFLEMVWNTYGFLDGWQLECLTHTETPWIRARGGLPELQRCTNIIAPVDMKKYYSDLYIGDGVGE